MTADLNPFVAAARGLFAKTGLCGLTFRHHGLGMLQAELTETLRLHIWDPRLKTLQGLRTVHDHRFNIESAVLHGVIFNVPYSVLIDTGQEWEGGPPSGNWRSNVPVYEVVHAKIQTGTHADFVEVGKAFVREEPTIECRVGYRYLIHRRDFHTTVVEDTAVTIIHRSDFDGGSARVLGPGGGILRSYQFDPHGQLGWVDRTSRDPVMEGTVQRVMEVAERFQREDRSFDGLGEVLFGAPKS